MRYTLIVIVTLPLVILGGCGQNSDSEFLAQTQRTMEKDNIIHRVNRLFIATDNRDWTAVKDCFADSVLFDMTSLAGGEPSMLSSQDIVSAWDKGLRALAAIHHQAGNHLVELKRNEAVVFCYGIAMHYLPNKTNRNVRTFVGSYDLHLVQKGNDWKIDRFKYNSKFIDGNLQLEKVL